MNVVGHATLDQVSQRLFAPASTQHEGTCKGVLRLDQGRCRDWCSRKHLSPKPLQNEYTILHSKYVDHPNDAINRKIEYKDEELSTEELALVNTMRDQLDTEAMIPNIARKTIKAMDIILGSKV